MKKYKNLIILIAALVLIFAAAYVVYNKYKPELVAQPPAQDNLPDGQSIDNGGTSDGDTAESGTAESGTTGDEAIMVPDFTLKDLEGNEVSLSDYKGKIVILNFWAVWCKYCIEEMPDFNKLDKELSEAGDAEILAVNVQEPYDTVNDYITKNGIDLKVILDEDGAISSGIFGINSYPTTFVVNKDGSLYTYIPGKTDIETMRTVIDMARENAPLQ